MKRKRITVPQLKEMSAAALNDIIVRPSSRAKLVNRAKMELERRR